MEKNETLIWQQKIELEYTAAVILLSCISNEPLVNVIKVALMGNLIVITLQPVVLQCKISPCIDEAESNKNAMIEQHKKCEQRALLLAYIKMSYNVAVFVCLYMYYAQCCTCYCCCCCCCCFMRNWLWLNLAMPQLVDGCWRAKGSLWFWGRSGLHRIILK